MARVSQLGSKCSAGAGHCVERRFRPRQREPYDASTREAAEVGNENRWGAFSSFWVCLCHIVIVVGGSPGEDTFLPETFIDDDVLDWIVFA